MLRLLVEEASLACPPACLPCAALCHCCSQGGVKEGNLVQLSNNAMALIVKVDEEEVLLDCNNMLVSLLGAGLDQCMHVGAGEACLPGRLAV